MYSKLFKTCAKEELTLWECPNFIFSLMGTVTIGVIIAAYFIASLYLSIELVMLIVLSAAVVFLILGYSVSNSVKQLGDSKREAEFEKAKTDAIITYLSDGLIMLDSQCRVALVNPLAEKFLGIKERDVLGLDVRSESINIELKDFFRVAHWCPKTSEKITNQVFREEISLGDQNQRYLKIQTSTATNKYGKLIGFVKVLHDITREKRLDEMKSDFISIASHQLKTPLSTMKWNLEVLQKGFAGKSTPEQGKIIAQTNEANEHLVKIVKDLLDVSQIEQGKIKPNLTLNSLIETTKEVASEYDLLADKRNIEFITNLPNKDIKFYFDTKSIKTVLTNLVDNAIKYTEGHGVVTLSLEYEPKNNPKQAKLSVTDTGIGISPDEQKQLFVKFYRGRSATKQKIGGTGLGLYIAKNIIDLHHGKLEVQSTKGKGSTFSIYLPLKFSLKNNSH